MRLVPKKRLSRIVFSVGLGMILVGLSMAFIAPAQADYLMRISAGFTMLGAIVFVFGIHGDDIL